MSSQQVATTNKLIRHEASGLLGACRIYLDVLHRLLDQLAERTVKLLLLKKLTLLFINVILRILLSCVS